MIIKMKLFTLVKNGAYIIENKKEIFHCEINKQDIYTITKNYKRILVFKYVYAELNQLILLNASNEFL